LKFKYLSTKPFFTPNAHFFDLRQQGDCFSAIASPFNTVSFDLVQLDGSVLHHVLSLFHLIQSGDFVVKRSVEIDMIFRLRLFDDRPVHDEL
jgi:hypothetical protein